MAKRERFNKGYEALIAKGGSPYDGLMRQIAEKYEINYDLWHKQIYLESSFNPKAKSSANARGLGQFVPATGKAYGLLTEADFYDPEKSLDASARHFKDLVEAYKGDELKAMLAYNQGAGRIGRSSLEAYDKGDFSKIRAEGFNYMTLLADKAKNGRNDFLDFVGVPSSQPRESELTPTSDMQFGSIEEGTKDWQHSWGSGLRAQSPQPLEYKLDSAAGYMNIGFGTGEESFGRDVTIREQYWNKEGRETADGSFRAFENTGTVAKESLKTSFLGSAVRIYKGQPDYENSGGLAALKDILKTSENPDAGWAPTDYERWRERGVQPSYYHVIARGDRSQEDANIAFALETQQSRQKISQAGLGAQLTGGLAAALGDPLTYTPWAAARAATLTGKVAWSAALGGASGAASEHLEKRASGGDQDVLTAAAFGVATAGLITGAAHGVSKLRGRESKPEVDQVFSKEGTETAPKAEIELLPPKQESTPQMPDAVTEAGSLSHPNTYGPAWTQSLGGEDYFYRYSRDSVTAQQLRLEDNMAAMQQGRDPYVGNRESVDYESLPKGSDPDVEYRILDESTGTVMMPNGAIIDGGSILNPETAIRASMGVNLGKYGQVGYVVSRSKNEEVLSLANTLFRSPTGYVDGSSGIKRSTASDIHGMLSDRDNLSFRSMFSLRDQALDDSVWSVRKNVGHHAFDELDKKIALARESGDVSNLTKRERKLLDAVGEWFDRKFDDMAFPAKYGDANAPAVLGSSRHAGRYFPVVYDGKAIDLLVSKYGKGAVKDALSRSYMGNYMTKPEVRQAVDEVLKDTITDRPITMKDVKEYAERIANGVTGDKSLRTGSLAAETEVTGVQGLRRNNFTEARHPFGNDYEVSLGGERFSPNDLRSFNIGSILPAYARKANGEVALHASTGRSMDEIVDLMTDLRNKYKGDGQTIKEIGYLENYLKSITGRSKADTPEGAAAALGRSANNLSYIAKHAYFAMQTFTEIAGMMAKGHTKMLFNHVPVLKHMATVGKAVKVDELRQFNAMHWGMELNNLLRPSKADTIEAIRNAGSSNRAAALAGNVKYYTQELSARAPLSRALPAAQNLIVESARMGGLSNILEYALRGTKPSKRFDFTKEGILNSMSVTPEQLDGVVKLLQKHFKQKPDGSYEFHNRAGFEADPASLDLWRIGDWLANEAVVRPERIQNTTAGYMSFAESMVLQFKQFTMQAVNSRFARLFNEATRNGRYVDQAVTAVLTTGLALAGYMLQRYSNSLAMSPERREKFLEESFRPHMLAYAAVSRSSHIGAPLGIANYFLAASGNDMARSMRTSVLPEYSQRDETRRDAMKGNPWQDSRTIGWMQGLAEQVPTLGLAAGAFQIGVNTWEGMQSPYSTYGYNTGIWEGFRNFVPNDPVTQGAYNALAREMGVDADL